MKRKPKMNDINAIPCVSGDTQFPIGIYSKTDNVIINKTVTAEELYDLSKIWKDNSIKLTGLEMVQYQKEPDVLSCEYSYVSLRDVERYKDVELYELTFVTDDVIKRPITIKTTLDQKLLSYTVRKDVFDKKLIHKDYGYRTVHEIAMANYNDTNPIFIIFNNRDFKLNYSRNTIPTLVKEVKFIGNHTSYRVRNTYNDYIGTVINDSVIIGNHLANRE